MSDKNILDVHQIKSGSQHNSNSPKHSVDQRHLTSDVVSKTSEHLYQHPYGHDAQHRHQSNQWPDQTPLKAPSQPNTFLQQSKVMNGPGTTERRHENQSGLRADLEYVGFMPRSGAALIDTLIMGAITWPILTAFYGESYWTSEEFIQGPMDFFLSDVFPMVITILFWTIKQATPGKMAISAKIVDAKTGRAPSVGQLIGRYFLYFLSILPLFLGIIWIAFDDRKQGWHDKLSGTVVVRPKSREKREVSFHG